MIVNTEVHDLLNVKKRWNKHYFRYLTVSSEFCL